MGRVVGVDLDPVVVPVDVRHLAIGAPRTRAERDVQQVEVTATRLPEVPQFEQEPLEQGDPLDLSRSWS